MGYSPTINTRDIADATNTWMSYVGANNARVLTHPHIYKDKMFRDRSVDKTMWIDK